MTNDTNSEHRAQAWAVIGGALVTIGGVGIGTLASVGASSHLWGDDVFLGGFAGACLLVTLGVYVLVGAFIVDLPLPPTRSEREDRRRRVQRQPARVIVSKGRIPLHTARSPEVGEAELQRIASSRTTHLGLAGVARVEMKPRKTAESQLAAAVRSGNVLRVRNQSDSPLSYQWRDEVEALVKESAGELDASRFTHSGDIVHWLRCLDELAQQVSAGTKMLRPSESWDAYVEGMMAFRQDLGAHLAEGERLRTELFSRALDLENGRTRVTAWRKDVDDALAPVPRYRDALRKAASPPHRFATYEGISQEESKVVWRLDEHLQYLQPLLTAIEPFVEALKGE